MSKPMQRPQMKRIKNGLKTYSLCQKKYYQKGWLPKKIFLDFLRKSQQLAQVINSVRPQHIFSAQSKKNGNYSRLLKSDIQEKVKELERQTEEKTVAQKKVRMAVKGTRERTEERVRAGLRSIRNGSAAISENTKANQAIGPGCLAGRGGREPGLWECTFMQYFLLFSCEEKELRTTRDLDTLLPFVGIFT